MVAIPITTDQPGMAARLAKAGAAEVVPLAKLDVFKLKAAIKRVFEDPIYRDNAVKVKLSNAIREVGGVNYAANVVEQAINTKAPVLNSRLIK